MRIPTCWKIDAGSDERSSVKNELLIQDKIFVENENESSQVLFLGIQTAGTSLPNVLSDELNDYFL